MLDGNDVDYARSTIQYDQDTGKSTPVVELVLKEEGKEAFSEATKKQYDAGKKPISILAGTTICCPRRTWRHILPTAMAVISGANMDAAYCTELANLINSVRCRLPSRSRVPAPSPRLWAKSLWTSW